MLEKLGYDGERIFTTEIINDGERVELMECCDMYYSVMLTKEEIIELANDLLKLSEEMK